jgi:hypothetical protein
MIDPVMMIHPLSNRATVTFDTLPVFGVLFGRTMFRACTKPILISQRYRAVVEQDYLERGIRYRIIDDALGSAPDFVEMSSLDAMTSPHIAVDHPDAEIKVR